MKGNLVQYKVIVLPGRTIYFENNLPDSDIKGIILHYWGKVISRVPKEKLSRQQLFDLSRKNFVYFYK